ncbi:MAG TPA: hypothetical protein VD931_09385 [Baekduia sp.]|nr:hypothetical protein [Baekduia sp.]
MVLLHHPTTLGYPVYVGETEEDARDASAAAFAQLCEVSDEELGEPLETVLDREQLILSAYVVTETHASDILVADMLALLAGITLADARRQLRAHR